MSEDFGLLIHGDFSPANLARIVSFSSSWFSTVFSCLAFSWIAFRAYRVLSKPVEELIGLLGLEVPVAPEISLAGIKADAVILHWKPLEKGHSAVKYVVRLNGVEIGEVGPHDSAAIVTNLRSESHYILRVATLNTAGFQATSAPLRIRTLPASSGDFHDHGLNRDEHGRPDEDGGSAPVPLVQVYRGFSESSISPAAPVPMTREHSNSQSRVKRGGSIRRESRTNSAPDLQETPAALQELQEKLEGLRSELEKEEASMADDDADFILQRDNLQKEKENGLKVLKDKSKASEDLRKEVNRVDQKRTAALGKRTQKEKAFKDAIKKRQDLKNDVAKWDSDVKKIREFVASTADAKEKHQVSAAQKLEEIRTKHEEELERIEQLSEETRSKRSELDDLEKERERLGLSDVAEATLANRSPEEVESDRQWEERLQSLQRRYQEVWTRLNETQKNQNEAQQMLNWYNARRNSQPHLFNPISPVDPNLPRRDSYHQRHRAGSRHESGGPSTGGYLNAASHSSQSPPFTSISPFFNFGNGTMQLPPTSQSIDMSASEIDNLVGGAPMSPTVATDLLPSFLTKDDHLSSTDENPPFLPGLGAPHILEQAAQGPASPVSAGSRPPSVYASPRESSTQLPFPRSTNDLMDSDRRSIHSTTSSLRNIGGSAVPGRFGSLFGLNRQRGKTLDMDGPSLGSLRGSETKSLPRSEFHLDPIGTPQRRGSHSESQTGGGGSSSGGGGWIDQMSSAFSRHSSKPADEENALPKGTSAKRRGFNVFGTRPDPWGSGPFHDKPPSPRPGSTRSGHLGALPRPSTESQERFGWPIDGIGPRNSGLATDWAMTHTNSWSRHPSRRPSVQYGQSTTSLGREGMYDSDELGDLPSSNYSPAQAPIGTRPTSSQAQMPSTPPKLNPAAPNFMMSMFSRERRADKADKSADKKAEKLAVADKKAEKLADKKAEKAGKISKKASKERKDSDLYKTGSLAPSDPAISITSPQPDMSASPPDSRKSKDTRSTSMTESPRNSLDRTNSYTPSEAMNTSSVGKESFMSKLSRKSSSGKFNFPSFTSSKQKRQASEVGTPDEIDEDGSGMPGFTPRSMQEGFEAKGSPALGSASGKSSSLSWSSFKRKSKKGDKTPSLHESTASEAGATTGDEDDHDDLEPALGLGLGLRGKVTE